MSDFAFHPRRRDEFDDFVEWDELADDEEAGEADHSQAQAPDPDPGRQNLYFLTAEFLGYLRREAGVPYTKGELAREQILRYILERYLGQLFGFLNPQWYKAATTFELIPAWLRFLESRWLIDAQQREKMLQKLQGLDSDLRQVLEHYPDDPALLQELGRWPEKKA